MNAGFAGLVIVIVIVIVRAGFAGLVIVNAGFAGLVIAKGDRIAGFAGRADALNSPTF